MTGLSRCGTVAELIAALEECEPGAVVRLTGCDCVGDWCGHIEGDAGSVRLCQGLDTLGSLECDACDLETS